MTDTLQPVYQEFGRQVRGRRAALGWSQARLGATLHPALTRASIANIEAGQQRVLLHTALDIAAALGLALESLLGRGSSVAGSAPDSESLAEELASKLAITSAQARHLVSKVSRKNGSVAQ